MKSDALKKLDFVPAAEAGMAITRSPNPEDRGTFYQSGSTGIETTVAIDESGEAWVAYGHVDLAPHGFVAYIPEKIH